MRVLCVNDRPPGGDSGAEVHLELLVDGLRAAGDNVEVFTGSPRSGVGRLADTWDRSAREALAQRVGSFRPEVVHFHNVVRELSVAVVGAAPTIPTLMTFHDGRVLGDADGPSWPLRWWQRRRGGWEQAFLRSRVDVSLAVSGPLAQRLVAAGFRDVRRVWPWAEAPSSPVTPPARCRDLLFVGRLDRDKGVPVLVQAFLAADRAGARLLLAGSGPVPLPDDPRVVRLGRLSREQVSAHLGRARAVVLASVPALRPEGAPMVLVEALLHGRPLVVSDDPGCLEVARVGTAVPAGLATPAGEVGPLAEALGRVLDDDRLVTSLAEGAEIAAADHDAQAGVAQVRTAYRDAIASRR